MLLHHFDLFYIVFWFPEAKLKRTQAPTPNLLPPHPPSKANSLGLQAQPEDMSDLDFGSDDEEEDHVVGESTRVEGKEEGAHPDQEEEEDELIDDALLDDPGLALLWDSPRELPSQAFTSLPASPLPPLPPPRPTSTSSSLLLPSSPPSAIPVRPRSQSIVFSDDHLLQPPLNSYSSTLTYSTTNTTHTDSTTSSSASPSTSYTRPNRFLTSTSPSQTRHDHPHRDRTLSRSRSRSSFTTISESPSPAGSLTPTSLNQQSALPPVPVAEPPVRRSVRFNPRTLLRPSSFGSYASDRSGELVSSSPMRGFMAWRLGGGPKPNTNNGRATNGSMNASSSMNPRNARVQKMPQVQSWTNYYGTFSNTSAEEIRGNPLLYEPVPRPSTSHSSSPHHHHREGSTVRKSEEDVLFGTGVWERVRSLDWWCWKMGLGAWWESEGGLCCGTGWEEDDWGDQSGSRSSRAVGEGRGFF